MSFFIPAPERRSPDGQGWNRLSLNGGAVSYGQCALRPRCYASLWESLNRPPHFGGYGPCVARGECGGCTVAGEDRRLETFTPDVLVRLRPSPPIDECHLMNKPEQGWASSSRVWTWAELRALLTRGGWRLGDRYRDEDGDGFWLHAALPRRHGCYGHEPGDD
jgi:hypothetical protein